MQPAKSSLYNVNQNMLTGTMNNNVLSPGYKTFGGARRDRTDDLLLAKQALSQLSYGP